MKNNKGVTHPNAKLTEEMVRAIREMQGVCAEIGRCFGVCASTIRQIRRRETWRHVL